MALEDLISERLGIPVDVIRSAWCSQTTDVAVKSLKSLGTPGDTTKSAWCPQTTAANPLKIQEKVPWGHEGTPGTPEKNNTCEKRMTVDELLAQKLADANPLKTQGTPVKRPRYGLPAQWERHLVTLGTQNGLARGGGRCIASALRFILAGWAEQALALGWTELELVGTDPQAPWERLDRGERPTVSWPWSRSRPSTSSMKAAHGGAVAPRRMVRGCRGIQEGRTDDERSRRHEDRVRNSFRMGGG